VTKKTLPALGLALTVALSFTPATTAEGPAATPDRPRPEIRYDPSPEALVVECVWAGDLYPDPSYYPFVRIYGDGRVVVTGPNPLEKGRSDVAYLEAGELDRLLFHFADLGLMAFDPKAVEDRTVDALRQRRARGELVEMISDMGTTRLHLNLTWFALSPEHEGLENYEKTIDWAGAEFYARTYPEVTEVANFYEATHILKILRKMVTEREDGDDIRITLPESQEVRQ
jgi:hypothetical protein